MQGYKTIVTNGLVLLFSLLAGANVVDIGVSEQAEITAGVLAVVNIVLRYLTTSAVFAKPEPTV